MALPDPTAPRFIKIGTEVQRLVCLTRVHYWHAHYDPKIMLPVRCNAADCRYCDEGRQRELRFVLGCFSARHGRVLLELRERHRMIVTEMDEHECRGVGSQLRLYRLGEARNSPIECLLEGWEGSEEWDIARLVDSLGTQPHSRKSEKERSSHDLTSSGILSNIHEN